GREGEVDHGARCGPAGGPGSTPAGASREVYVAAAVPIVLPCHVAAPLRALSRHREAGTRLLAAAAPRVIHALRRGEPAAAVGAGREEDVVVAETVVLPRDEEPPAVDGERRVPLVGRRFGVGIEAALRVVELPARREAGAAVVAARMEDVGVGLARPQIGPG